MDIVFTVHRAIPEPRHVTPGRRAERCRPGWLALEGEAGAG